MGFIKDFQDFIVAIVTLVAAFIGFGSVIYSQRSLARMTKEQAEDQKTIERKAFRNAMIGELSALQVGVKDNLQMIDAHIAMAEEPGTNGSKKIQPRITFLFATPVFDTHVARIGVLSPELSFKISNLYGRLKSYSSQSQKDVPELEGPIAAKVMKSVSEGLRTLDSEITELKADLRLDNDKAYA